MVLGLSRKRTRLAAFKQSKELQEYLDRQSEFIAQQGIVLPDDLRGQMDAQLDVLIEFTAAARRNDGPRRKRVKVCHEFPQDSPKRPVQTPPAPGKRRKIDLPHHDVKNVVSHAARAITHKDVHRDRKTKPETDADRSAAVADACVPMPRLHKLFSLSLAWEDNFMFEDYMAKQPALGQQCRHQLVTWMGEVKIQFNFGEPTLFLSVNVLDRFLAALTKAGKKVPRSRLQCIGVACLMIASKYEEQKKDQMKVKDFEWMTNSSCSSDSLSRMEKRICTTLDWFVAWKSNPEFFLDYFQKCTGQSAAFVNTALYLVQLGMLKYDIWKLGPVILSGTAWAMAGATHKTPYGFFEERIYHFTKQDTSEAELCWSMLSKAVKRARKDPRAQNRVFPQLPSILGGNTADF